MILQVTEVQEVSQNDGETLCLLIRELQWQILCQVTSARLIQIGQPKPFFLKFLILRLRKIYSVCVYVHVHAFIHLCVSNWGRKTGC